MENEIVEKKYRKEVKKMIKTHQRYLKFLLFRTLPLLVTFSSFFSQQFF